MKNVLQKFVNGEWETVDYPLAPFTTADKVHWVEARQGLKDFREAFPNDTFRLESHESLKKIHDMYCKEMQQWQLEINQYACENPEDLLANMYTSLSYFSEQFVMDNDAETIMMMLDVLSSNRIQIKALNSDEWLYLLSVQISTPEGCGDGACTTFVVTSNPEECGNRRARTLLATRLNEFIMDYPNREFRMEGLTDDIVALASDLLPGIDRHFADRRKDKLLEGL